MSRWEVAQVGSEARAWRSQYDADSQRGSACPLRVRQNGRSRSRTALADFRCFAIKATALRAVPPAVPERAAHHAIPVPCLIDSAVRRPSPALSHQ
jgi:hypothetical protein